MGRGMAGSRMTETVRVGTAAPGEFDPTTGTYPDAVTLHYSGPGRIKYPSMVVSEKTPVGQVLAAQGVVLSLPVGEASAVEINDTVWVDASEVDDDLVGEKFRIEGEPQRGQVTSHRFPVVSLP
jgi:hypothetical protein